MFYIVIAHRGCDRELPFVVMTGDKLKLMQSRLKNMFMHDIDFKNVKDDKEDDEFYPTVNVFSKSCHYAKYLGANWKKVFPQSNECECCKKDESWIAIIGYDDFINPHAVLNRIEM